jgi:hypothetical protein
MTEPAIEFEKRDPTAPYFTCPDCGAKVADLSRHLAWHQED